MNNEKDNWVAVTPRQRAVLEWDEANQPYSTQFEDHYFSSGKGREETRFVFLQSNGLPERWSGMSDCVIGELGFGTGLSFLETWATWRENRVEGQQLIFQSVEGFPMSAQDLERALSPWSDLSPLKEHLLEIWEELANGPVQIDEQTVLQVVMEDVTIALERFEHPVDTWFLDGFAPARNPQMWSVQVMESVAAASAPGARFASYTAAGWVRQNLRQARFQVERRPGFGNKRHMIAGYLEDAI
ncbi:tRNA (5-methylaminomethyl-2-thiouridine)(34)-methyltransferase MnmD [Pseudahrensia aquimaris]|uniref:tRNA (5-methylaminomethyl-2-thiouridine)(34)-methyltransferase MnmD n=1 Tax=Pseudahrensia aquimaris TaxID=744461 RepID=A0ABW3FG03_9HYPH